MTTRLAIVASHPIQYQAPWFRALARETDLTVFFCQRQDAAGQAAAGFGVEFDWDVPLLDGYRFHWLENRARTPDVSTFSGCDTPELDQRIRTGNFDACIVSGWYLKSYLQAIRACRKYHVPVFLRGDSQLATRRSPLVGAAKYLPYRWLLRHVDGHLYVGHANREYLRHYGVPDNRLFFVPHFVDNAFFADRVRAARADGSVDTVRRDAAASSDTSLFVFAGKLVDKKRPADFIRALARAKETDAVCGVMVGSGSLDSELRRLAADLAAPVTFAGFRNQTELPAYFAAADALVLPSDAGETWGLVVNEAMACGTPAIVSRAAGCAPDLIDENETGYTFELGDVNGLADRMKQVRARLQRGRNPFTPAVLDKIARYDVRTASSGTLEALASTRAAMSQAI